MPVRLIARQPLRCASGGWMVDKGPRPVATASIPSPWRVGLLKEWDGAAWTAKPNKFWNGSAWVTKPIKFYSSDLVNLRAPNPPNGAVIVGQVLFATDMGDWSSTPTSYAIDWYDDNGAIGSPTQDSYLIQDAELGQHIYYRVTATLGAQNVTVMSAGTVAVAAIDLSNAITDLTRTSSSGVTPMTWSLTFGSSAFEGYTLRAKVYSDSGLSTLLQDVEHLLTNADMQSGATIDLTGDGLTSIGATDWLQLTVETTSPNGIFYSYTYPTAISPTDAVVAMTWSTTDKTNITLSGGNLTATATATWAGVRSNRGIGSGQKIYFELTGDCYPAVADSTAPLTTPWGGAGGDGSATTAAAEYQPGNSFVFYNGSGTAAAGYTAGSTWGVTLDTTGSPYVAAFYKNNVLQATKNLSSIGATVYLAAQLANSHAAILNPGTTPGGTAGFTYTPPTGFVAP